ncbi:hypothetical protein B0T16DRAFT_410564 [Cercophora newfieldiana]|uniref:Nephrocystin 3-like N-terminal domain-containing protein n=1 Tax=Cercophora newfieldiana TaxID=92897 RepID=A0AA40CUN4_9PEZI|nr:hypothetical protein B0T16DRAFT_410564 [Cercophora newfieldiana]
MAPAVSAKGISVLHEPANPTTDIVFVHGFTGHPKSTWTLERSKVRKRQRDEAPPPPSKFPRFGWKKAGQHDSGQHAGPSQRLTDSKTRVSSFSSEKSHGTTQAPSEGGAGGEQEEVYWPYHLLPSAVPSARVMTYGYDTRIRHFAQGPISQNTMHDHAWDLLCTLEARRRAPEENKRPLVLIAHSLGGIVVKEMLKRAQESGATPGRSYLHEIFQSTIGVVFFGTPHRGADPRAFLHHVISVSAQGLGVKANKDIVEELLPRAGRQPDTAAFAAMACQQQWTVYSFQEEYGVSGLFGKKVVDDHSSCLDIPFVETVQHIGSNHMDMCRFHGAGDVGYQKVVAALQRVIGSEPLTASEDDTLPQPPIFVEAEKSPSESKARVIDTPEHVAQDGASAADDDPQVPENSLTKEQRARLLDLLRFDQIDARLMTLRTAQSKTCQWFLSTPEFVDWLNVERMSQHGGLLWIKGKPGAGKSILMKYLFSHAQKNTFGKRSEAPIIVSFFFNARGDKLEQSTLGCYRSILLQLLEKAPELRSAMDHLIGSGFRYIDRYGWNVECLTQILVSVVGLLKRSVKCFVDALDECDETEVREMVRFFEHLGETANSAEAEGRLHLCFSSRHYPSIVPKRGLQVTLEDREEHHNDIARYVESELRLGNSLQTEEITAMILSRCSNIFLWAALVIPILNREYANGRMAALRKRLDSVPPGLDDLFDMILTRDNENMDELRVCIQFILFSVAPLTPQGLSVAVQLGLDQGFDTRVDPKQISMADYRRYVDSSSKGLAEVTRSSRPTVQFIHESVRDFLLGKGGRRNRWSGFGDALNIGIAHDFLKRCCFAQLRAGFNAHFQDREFDSVQTDVTKEPKPKNAKYPFLEYAVMSVLEHANYAQGEGLLQTSFINDFPLCSWVLLHNMFETYQVRRHSIDVHPIYIFAHRNLANLIRSHPAASTHFSIRGGRYQYPIIAAMALRHAESLHALAATVGVEISINTCARLLGRQSISQSLKFFEESRDLATYLVELDDIPLLQRCVDADVDGPTTFTQPAHSPTSRTLLFWARSTAMASFLISRGVDPNFQDSSGMTALHNACQMASREPDLQSEASEEVIGLLLSNPRVDITLQDDKGFTALHYACDSAAGSAIRIVERFINHNAFNPNTKSLSGLTALHLAMGSPHVATVEMLASSPALDFHAQNFVGRRKDKNTLLHHAVRMRHSVENIRCLLSRHWVTADMFNLDEPPVTPLMLAAEERVPEIAAALIDSGRVRPSEWNCRALGTLIKLYDCWGYSSVDPVSGKSVYWDQEMFVKIFDFGGPTSLQHKITLLNQRSFSGCTLVSHAACGGHFQYLLWLLDRCPAELLDLSADAAGTTPLLLVHLMLDRLNTSYQRRKLLVALKMLQTGNAYPLSTGADNKSAWGEFNFQRDRIGWGDDQELCDQVLQAYRSHPGFPGRR